jgi:copper(I)-binding protein
MTRSTGAVLLAVLALQGCHPARGGHAAAGDLSVAHVVVPASASATEASAFLVVTNHGSEDRALTGATSPDADSVRLHRSIGGLMEPAASVPVPAHGYALLGPGTFHLMIEGLHHAADVGDTITLQLQFDQGGPISVRAPVLTYTDAVSDLPMR